ncbi:MAG: hypothetical protein MUP03_10085, partial [Anaerolineales bacterium]|nr:hypothetical protein [Anaerolineales bacterium]
SAPIKIPGMSSRLFHGHYLTCSIIPTGPGDIPLRAAHRSFLGHPGYYAFTDSFINSTNVQLPG